MSYLLGLDIGSSSIKASLLDVERGEIVTNQSSPARELEISSPKPGWAEQDPEVWWENVVLAIHKTLLESGVAGDQVIGIGIAYQMHGLVLIDKDHRPLRPAIIWCDSRAVQIGKRSFHSLGEEYCLNNLFNSPGNFTASKVRWVMEHEPELFRRAYKILLPGDYIALKLSDQPSTTITGLSEGIFWDFKRSELSPELINYYEIPRELFPLAYSTFERQGELSAKAAAELGIPKGVPITYRAGDQPNNAFSLNVLSAGEVAATAGTSGVVYGVSDNVKPDMQSRVNVFAHVNHTKTDPHLGILLCINGTGILNSWLKNKVFDGDISYAELDKIAELVPPGAEKLSILPFGNGAERVLDNRELGSSIHGIDFTRHTRAHLSRAAQEGVVFALYYGIEVMAEMGLTVNKIRAGRTNMFQSKVFCEAFASVSGAVVELYNSDGSQGAARGAGIGLGVFEDFPSAFRGLKCEAVYQPSVDKISQYKEAYQRWHKILNDILLKN